MTGSQILTATLTTTDGSAHTILTIPIANDAIVNVIYRILGISNTLNASSYYYSAAFARQITVQNAEGTMMIINSGPHTIGSDDLITDGGTHNFSASASLTSGNLLIKVTGNSSGSTVKWYILADVIEDAK